MHFSPKYLIPKVGGDEDQFTQNPEWIKDQKDMINKRNETLPPEIKTNDNNENKTLLKNYEPLDKDRYDAYIDYRYKVGTLDENNERREDNIMINIDSRHRVLKSSLILGDSFTLEQNPLQFTEGNKNIFVNHPNHPFEINDRITLSNVTTDIVKLLHTATNPAIEFTVNSNYVKVYAKLKLPDPSTVSQSPNYINKEMSVRIRGFEGDTIIRMGNININEINSNNLLVYTDLSVNAENMDEENIFDFNPANQDNVRNVFGQPPYDPNVFYIRLNERYFGNNTLPPSEFKLLVQLNEISGIPINIINSDIPITPDNLVGFQIINKISENGYFFEVNDEALFDVINKGGNCVTVKKVNDVVSSFPNPNSYTIQLPQTFSNIIGSRIKGCNFPQPYNITENNNKLYFSTLANPDTVRTITLQTGYYDFKNIVCLIKDAFDSQAQATIGIGSLINIGGDVSLDLEILEEMIIEVDYKRQIISFSLFETSVIEEPIYPDETVLDIDNETTPSGSSGPSQVPYPCPNQVLYTKVFAPSVNPSQFKLAELRIFIEYPFIDGLEVGDKIRLNDVIGTHGLGDDDLNGEFEIVEITSVPILISGEFREGFFIEIGGNDRLLVDGTYKKAKKYSLNCQGSKNHGGNCVRISRPKPFRMDFSQSDTLGTILGFRDVGEEYAITPFASTIKNTDKYFEDITLDTSGEQIEFRNEPFRLLPASYFYMVCPQLNNSLSTGPIRDYFAKIKINKVEEELLNEGYLHKCVENYRLYNAPINELFQLEFEFRYPDGSLVEWANQEHSFIIELTIIREKPKGTEISAATGRNIF
ncbi:MAG: hypothetical protein CMF62_02265 [Magnetococcales bacterium]|nr:hypothetical protein [Magnetococcales bacterium]